MKETIWPLSAYKMEKTHKFRVIITYKRPLRTFPKNVFSGFISLMAERASGTINQVRFKKPLGVINRTGEYLSKKCLFQGLRLRKVK